MFRKQAARIGLGLIAVAILCITTASAARRNSADVLVVPSRYTIIQFAFDIAALRHLTLVAYDNGENAQEPLLYTWDANNGAWKRITVDEYAVGAFSAEEPDEMILVGSDELLPAAVIAGASQARNVTRIETLNLMTVANTLHKRLDFSPREWKLLAKRHGLQIKDMNYERRRWGRYGPPGKERTKPVEAVAESAEEAIAEAEELEPEEEEKEEEQPVQLSPVEEKGAPVVESIEDALPVEPEAKATVEPEEKAEVVEKDVPAAMAAEDEVIETAIEPSPADK